MYSTEQMRTAITKCLEEKGSRKFVQSLELIMNFKDVDFSKSENKLALDVPLPKGRGKKVDVIVFADGQMAEDARAAGAELVITPTEIPSYDKGKIRNLAKNGEFFSQPQMMMVVGKNFGQLLGARGRLPKPLVGNVGAVLKNVRNIVHVRTRGKNLPAVHCAIGTESMSGEDLTENAMAVLSAVSSKLGNQALASTYVKLSMGKPCKVQ